MGTRFSNFEENVLECIYTENLPTLKQLLSNADDCGKSLSTPLPYDEHGRSLLHLVAWSGNHDQLLAMLENNPDVNIQDYYGWTPLMVCLYKGNIQSAYALLQKSAKFDASTREAMWLLQHAVKHGLLAIVSILLERSVTVTNSRPSLLNIAVDTENVAMTRLLLEKGKCNPNNIDELGWAPIHLASGHDNLPILKILLEFDADINLKDRQGNTPLAWARHFDCKLVKSELEKLNAVCDDIWHEDEKKEEEFSESANYFEKESEVDEEEMEDECFSNAEEYLDEYRNELWREVNQEIEEITASDNLNEDDSEAVHEDTEGNGDRQHIVKSSSRQEGMSNSGDVEEDRLKQARENLKEKVLEGTGEPYLNRKPIEISKNNTSNVDDSSRERAEETNVEMAKKNLEGADKSNN